MFSSVIVSLALAASALANVFITYPVAGTTFTAGQPANVTWIDSGSSPSLEQFGIGTFGIYVGNSNQQTLVQILSVTVNVSSINSLAFTPISSIGPNSDKYFIRATSQSFKDPSAPQYFMESFSAFFSLTNMTGTFNSTIQAEINGESTAPIGGPTSSGAPAASGGVVTTTFASAPTSSPSTSTNGASQPVITTSLLALVAMFVGISLL